MRAGNRLIRTLKEEQLTLALAESMTCGLAAESLASVHGVSDVLLASVVCYHEKAKSSLLHVPSRVIKKHTAESQEVTDRMVKELKKLLRADIYAAITGLASSGGSESYAKPVGTVFFSVMVNGKLTRLRKQFRGTPKQIRRKSCEFLYTLIIRLCRTTR